MMYTIRVSDGVDKVIAKWKKSNPNLFKKYKKIYLNGELEQSVYDVAIVNPNIKATPVIVNASLENTLGQLKIMNRALDYKENKNMVLK